MRFPSSILLFAVCAAAFTPASLNARKLGDLDGDDRHSIYDLVRLANHYNGVALLPRELAPFADVNLDGAVNDADARLLADAVLGIAPLIEPALASIGSTSPSAGEEGVAVMRETVFRLTLPLGDAGIIQPAQLFAEFGGRRILSRIEISSDRRTVTLFYLEPLPGGARVRVTFRGDGLTDFLGRALDLNGDGQSGGDAVLDFDTISLTPVQNTAVIGRVFASELVRSAAGANEFVNVPLAGVTITVDGREESLRTVTDPFGNFRLEPVPAGNFFVHIDGRTATRTATNDFPQGAFYPFVNKEWRAPAGEEVHIGNIYLPLILPGTLQSVSANQDTLVTFPEAVLADNPSLAGVSITVPPNALLSENGARGGMIGIAPVSPDRLPEPLPAGLNFPLVITVQTDGPGNFDRPVPACFPNLPDPVTGQVLIPGAKSALWSFNHDIGDWEVVGPMTVSDDGKLICTDPGVGIRQPGWHGAAPGSTLFGGLIESLTGLLSGFEPPSGNPGDATDPVHLFSGEFYLVVEDFRVPGRGFDFVWERTYRSRTGTRTPQGHGWDFSYNIYLSAEGPDLILRSGNGRIDRYSRLPNGNYGSSGFFQELIRTPQGGFRLLQEDRSEWRFLPLDAGAAAGKIETMVDRNGNSMAFFYDPSGQLQRIRDTLDRDIRITFNAAGLIASVTDFVDRTVRYEYFSGLEAGGSPGDLKAVSSPAVVGTPNGNDFPAGKTTRYTYSSGFPDERLNHNLLTVTDGRRNDPDDPTVGLGPSLNNVYAAAQDPEDATFDRVLRQIWGGDVLDITYMPLLPSNANGQAGMLVLVNDRNGNVKEYVYDQLNRMIRQREYTGQANPRQPTTALENRPVNKLRPDDPEFYETRFIWNSDSLQTRIIYPNGNVTEYEYEADLNPAAPAVSRGNLREMRFLPGSHSRAGQPPMLRERWEYGDQFHFITRHIDSRGNETRYTYDERGNRTRIQSAIPGIADDFEYSAPGQMTAHVHPPNASGHRRRDEFVYFPDGAARGYLAQQIIDAGHLSLTSRFEYDPVGNMVRIVDPRGNDQLFVVNSLNQVVRAFAPALSPGGVRYQRDFYYDANNNLIRVDTQNVNALGELEPNSHFSTHYEYEALNYLTRVRQEVAEEVFITTEYEYDANRNRTLIRSGEAASGRQPRNTLTTIYDERDLPLRITRAAGDELQSSREMSYDGNRNHVRVAEGVEGVARITLTEFDAYNRPVRSVDPMGNVTLHEYDGNHNRVRVTVEGELVDVPGTAGNRRLSETASVYDALNRLTRIDAALFDAATQAPVGDGFSTSERFFAGDSQISRIVDDNGHETIFQYDTANRLASVRDQKGNLQSYTYDARGNVLEITQVELSDLGTPAETYVTRMVHDPLNRLARRIDPGGHTHDFGYDSRGNRTVHLDAARAATDLPGNRTSYEFDGLNRLVRTVHHRTSDGTGAGQPLEARVVTQAWDDNSRLVAQTDPNGRSTRYGYDPLDRLQQILYADGTMDSFNHDPQGNRISRIDANGTVVTSQHDLLNREIGKSIRTGAGVAPAGAAEVYQYDGLSRLVRAVDDDSEVVRIYDSLSRLTAEQLNGEVTRTELDGVGNVLATVLPGGRRIETRYDELNRKTEIRDAQGDLAVYAYAGPSRVVARSFGNGTGSSWAYDPSRRVRETSHSRADGNGAVNGPARMLFDHRAYSWDSNFNKTSHADQLLGSSDAFSYDSLHRLTRSSRQAAARPAIEVAYQYDLAGNRTQVNGGLDPGAYDLSPAQPAPQDAQVHQYTAVPGETRSYDANGNLISIQDAAGLRRFQYDYRNQLVGIEPAGNGVPLRFRYDTLGRRIEKSAGTAPSRIVRYFHSHWQLCEQQDGNGRTLATFVYGPFVDEPIQMEKDGGEYFFHTDDLFSVRQVTDATGQVVESYDYADFGEPFIFDPAGNALAQSAIGNSILFQGREYDAESGLYQFRTRYLDPRAGRFITRDPLGAWGSAANTGNPFLFVGNNPASAMDPLGLDREIVIGPHSFIRVDTYDRNGNKTGQRSLHFMPAKLWGVGGSDWRSNLPRNDDWHNQHINFSVKIESTQAEDEILLEHWRQQGRSSESQTWNPILNCWWSAFSNYDVGIARDEHWVVKRARAFLGPFNNLAIDRIFGISRDRTRKPGVAYIAPEPDQGWIESGRRLLDDGLESAEGVAQKVIDFFDDPKPALDAAADWISSWFTPSPAPATPAPMSGSTPPGQAQGR